MAVRVAVIFRLLGPVELWGGGRRLDVGPPRQVTVLAALAAEAGRVVPVDALVDRVWGEDPPATARRSLQSYLARLRGVLAAAAPDGPQLRLPRRSGGYLLEAPRDTVDVHRFTDLVARARQPELAAAQRAAVLGAAVELWRGPALGGVAGEWAAGVRQAWREQYLAALVAWARAMLAVDEPDAVLGRLTAALGEHPLVEPLAGALMRALAAAGRPAQALEVFAATRQRLAEELGADPSPELVREHELVLRGNAPAAAAVPVRPAAPEPPVPAMLPATVYGFVGRVGELARLDAVLAEEEPASVVISAVSGTAGVGKTALAVHWAQRARDRFPDGQLYANLRGFDPAGPVDAGQVVRTFLEALGVPADRIPVDPEARLGRYRSELADRRLLLVLDNARDAAQVRPLLPGSAGCLVLITSRNRLSGLVALEGARPLTVDLLDPAEAGLLLSRRLGAQAVAAEPDAVAEIIARCDRLPLALAIVAARAASQPAPSLAAVAAGLRAARDRLDQLTTDDDAGADVRAAFSWSYEQLAPATARLFRLLGLHPGPDLPVAAAASLAGIPLGEARDRLAELVTAHLATEQRPGRYHLHDLLRAYAGELAQRSGAEAGAALDRLVDHYVRTAAAAVGQVEPEHRVMPLEPQLPGVVVQQLSDRAQALAWFAAERVGAVSTLDRAMAAGADRQAFRLTEAMQVLLDRQGYWQELAALGEVAMRLAGRLADDALEGRAYRELAHAYIRLGRQSEAAQLIERALALPATQADPRVVANCHHMLAMLRVQQGRFAEAIEHARQTAGICRTIGYAPGEALALNLIAWCHLEGGDPEQALASCGDALRLQRAAGHTAGEADTLDTIGLALHNLGRYADAIRHYGDAIALSRQIGNRYLEASSRSRLGDSHQAAGHPDRARECWQRAAEIFDEIGHPAAAEARAKRGPPQSAG